VRLASASPRRAELLRQLGLRFDVVPSDVDESPLAGERPEDFVVRIAADKAMAGRAALDARSRMPVLGADTAVVLGDQVMGKPRDPLEALEMLAALSGREHRVLTGVALATPAGLSTRLSESRVHFRPITQAERRAYVATGEPLDKAGAYAIQGLAAIFVVHLAGSYSGIMGLPIFDTAELLAEAGVPVLDVPVLGAFEPEDR
jgi:septum formation protein